MLFDLRVVLRERGEVWGGSSKISRVQSAVVDK